MKPRQLFTVVTQLNCSICKAPNFIFQCLLFLKIPVEERIHETKERNLCINYLKPNNHRITDFKLSTCRVCKKGQNSLLHVTRATGMVGSVTNSTDQAHATTNATVANIPIAGISGNVQYAHSIVKVQFKSLSNGFSVCVSCFVLKK